MSPNSSQPSDPSSSAVVRKGEARISDMSEYAVWIRSIKERVRQARLRALFAANTEQLLLNWDLGREIIDKQKMSGWGAKVVEQMSKDLKAEFPEMAGFSARNLKYMRAFASAWKRTEIVQAPLAQLPWYHQIALIELSDDGTTNRHSP